MSPRRARVVVAYATVKVLDPATGKVTVHGFHRDTVFPLEADPENVANLVRRGYAEWLDTAETKAVEKEETEAEEDRAPANKSATKAAKA